MDTQLTQHYYRPFRRQITNLEKRYLPDPKPFNIFCWFDQDGEVSEMFGTGFSWSRSRDGGEPPEITDEFIASARATL